MILNANMYKQCFCFVLSQQFEMYPKWLQTYNIAKAAFSQFFCLPLLNSEITGVCHHISESFICIRHCSYCFVCID